MRAAVLAAIIPLAMLSASQAPQPARPAGYAGMAACRACHAGIYETYQRVGMARTFDKVGAVPRIEDWSRNNRVFHRASRQFFEMSERGGRFFQRRYRLDERGRAVHAFEQEIHYALGSGNKERDYLSMSEAGELTQLPIVWYADEKAWGIAPGYDHETHEGFSRKINYGCFACHNAYPKLPTGADRYESQVPFFPKDLPNGIDCERCHGPGAQHVTLASSAGAAARVRASIVNPARLGRKLQLDVCMQCHLETTSAPLPNRVQKLGRGFFSFKPGEALEDYAAYFDYPKGTGHDDDFNIVHQAYRLRKSQCFQKSEMTCTTCHDPHRVPEDRVAEGNAKCAACHESAVCKLDAPTRQRTNQNNCAACHMPQRRTDDVIHDIMTDHYIQRRPPGNLLGPRKDPGKVNYPEDLAVYLPEPNRDLYLGMALIRAIDPSRGLQMLERAIKQGVRDPEAFFQAASAHQKLGQFDLAADYYRRAIAADPGFAEAHYNLGLMLLNTASPLDAIAAFQTSLRHQPALADAHVAIAAARARLNDEAEATRHNLEAVRIDPLNTLALNNLAFIAARAGRQAEAVRYFERVLAVNPDDPVAIANLKRLQPQ